MLPLFLQLSEKGPKPKWTIYKHVSDKNKKCLSVGNFEILSVVLRLSVCIVSTAYTSLFYEIFTNSKEVWYIILNYPIKECSNNYKYMEDSARACLHVRKFSISFISRLSTFQGRGVKFFFKNSFAKKSFSFFFAQIPDKKGLTIRKLVKEMSANVVAIQNTTKR